MASVADVYTSKGYAPIFGGKLSLRLLTYAAPAPGPFPRPFYINLGQGEGWA